MAAFVTTIALARADAPDPAALVSALRQQIDASVDCFFIEDAVRLNKSTDWTAAQVALAQSIIQSCASASPRLAAQTEIDNWPISVKALALALLDQINVLRTASGLVAITPAQALAAIRTKAGTL